MNLPRMMYRTILENNRRPFQSHGCLHTKCQYSNTNDRPKDGFLRTPSCTILSPLQAPMELDNKISLLYSATERRKGRRWGRCDKMGRREREEHSKEPKELAGNERYRYVQRELESTSGRHRRRKPSNCKINKEKIELEMDLCDDEMQMSTL